MLREEEQKRGASRGTWPPGLSRPPFQHEPEMVSRGPSPTGFRDKFWGPPDGGSFHRRVTSKDTIQPDCNNDALTPHPMGPAEGRPLGLMTDFSNGVPRGSPGRAAGQFTHGVTGEQRTPAWRAPNAAVGTQHNDHTPLPAKATTHKTRCFLAGLCLTACSARDRMLVSPETCMLEPGRPPRRTHPT